jgi:hypothetical protein
MKKSRPPLFERLKSSLEDIALYAKGEKSLVETQLMIPEPPPTYGYGLSPNRERRLKTC